MHERTYADETVTAYQDKFVWILVDTNVSMANQDVADEYELKLEEELSEVLAYPTAIFIDTGGKMVRAKSGKIQPEEFVKMMKDTLGD
ncbi:MAG: hypothetical protein ACYTFG_02140 [Planctomycetota bacterium]|jgi:thioredoxin-related protein